MNQSARASRVGSGFSNENRSPLTRSLLQLSSSTRGMEGQALPQWLAIIALLCLGWFFSTLWSPLKNDPPQADPAKEPTLPIQTPKSVIGNSEAEVTASPLDSLSENDQKISNSIFQLFQKCQWDKALDASTAHRVARARDDLQELLDGLGPEHVPLLVGMLKEEPDFINRRFLIKALGKIGSDEALIGLIDHYHWSVDVDKESEVKHTIDALALANTDMSLKVLREYSMAEDAVRHRYRFVEALTRHERSEEALDIYGQLLRDPSHFRVRQRAAYGLKINGVNQHSQSLETALAEEMNPYVRQSYLGALGGIQDVNSIPVVERILIEDEDVSTRISAVRALLNIEGSAAIQALMQARDRIDPSPRVQQEIITALQKLGYEG